MVRLAAPECAVCLEVTTDVLEACGHPLCHVCAAEWLHRSASCPTCRAPVAGRHLPPGGLPPLTLPTGEDVRQLHFRVAPGRAVSYRLGQFRAPGYTAVLVLGLRGAPEEGDAALRRGDVISHLDGRRVHAVGEVSRALDEAIDEGRPLRVGVVVAPVLRLAARPTEGRL